MNELSLDAHCRRHPDREAAGTCDLCRKAYCSECRVEDVATERSFCSEECKAASRSAAPAAAHAREPELAHGLEHPIRTGTATWARSVPQLALGLAPLAVLVAFVTAASSAIASSIALTSIYVVLALFGFALVGVLAARAHTGHDVGNPYLHTLKRFLPWAVAWIALLGTTIVGYVLLIVPGVYWNMRLFWADEFALVHRHGPFAALDQSWRLSTGMAWKTFALEFLLGFVAVPVVFAVAFGFLFVSDGLGAVMGESGAYLPVLAAIATLLGLLGYSLLHAMQISFFYGLRTHPGRRRTVADAKPMPMILKIVGLPAGLLAVGLIAFGLMLEAGGDSIPSDRVLAGADVPESQRAILLEESVIHEDERIEVFYSEGLTSVREGGSVLTDRRLIAYGPNEQDVVEGWVMWREDIGEVEQLQQGDAFNFSIYRVASKDGEYWLDVWLPHEHGDDTRFIQAVRRAARAHSGE